MEVQECVEKEEGKREGEMSVYIFGQVKEYVLAKMDVTQVYSQELLGEFAQTAKYVSAEIPDQEEIGVYRKAGIDAGQVLNVYQYLTDNHTIVPSVEVSAKLVELKNSLQYTGVDYQDSEIRLIKDGYVIATVILDRTDKSCLWGICYFSYAKLLRMEIYTDGIAYINYYVTAKSEHGLYAKLTRRTFYNRDASAAYDQIFEGEKEWYLFPDGRRYTKLQFMVEFIKRLQLSEQDILFLDCSVPKGMIQAIFTFGRRARIVVAAHAGYGFRKAGDTCESVLEGYPFQWVPYSEIINTMFVSTEIQKNTLIEELKKCYCHVPDIKVLSIEGNFTYTALYESYHGNLALSWEFQGRPDGFGVYDKFGARIYETENGYQHYFLIKGYEKESSFLIKAYAETPTGKITIAESGWVYLLQKQRKEAKASLIIPVYNAETFIARALDQALAQSLSGLEIITVDDGSRDSTPSILEWYAREYPNVKVIRQENSGVAAARNTGIEAAQGRYIGFMDSDDMIYPDMLIQLYHAAEKNNCDIVLTSSYTIKENIYTKNLTYALRENVPITVDEFLHVYNYGNVMGEVVWNKLYNAALVKKHLFPNIPYEDTAWTPCIVSYANAICYMDSCLYEWNRIVRGRTLSQQLSYYTHKEIFERRREAVLFYLKNGNRKNIKLLKESAKASLLRWESEFDFKEYGKLWRYIDEKF